MTITAVYLSTVPRQRRTPPAGIPANLVTLRVASKVTQEDLEAVGLNQSAVSKWETGQMMPEVPSLLRLAVFYRVPLDVLVAGVDADYDTLRSELSRHTSVASSQPSNTVVTDASAPSSRPFKSSTPLIGIGEVKRLTALAQELVLAIAALEQRASGKSEPTRPHATGRRVRNRENDRRNPRKKVG